MNNPYSTDNEGTVLDIGAGDFTSLLPQSNRTPDIFTSVDQVVFGNIYPIHGMDTEGEAIWRSRLRPIDDQRMMYCYGSKGGQRLPETPYIRERTYAVAPELCHLLGEIDLFNFEIRVDQQANVVVFQIGEDLTTIVNEFTLALIIEPCDAFNHLMLPPNCVTYNEAYKKPEWFFVCEMATLAYYLWAIFAMDDEVYKRFKYENGLDCLSKEEALEKAY